MNPEEERAYLQSLYDKSKREEYSNKLLDDASKLQKSKNDFEYYIDQYKHDKTKDIANATYYDFDASEEATRLGTTYDPDSQFNTENLWRHQGMGEQVWNASNRFLWNTFYDTAGGFAAMADLPGYFDPNSGAFKEVAEWAARKKAETADQYKIHQKEDAGMLGPGMVAWWIENGSSLASSATSFAIQGAGIGKALQGAKWLSSLNKTGKGDDLARRGIETATGKALPGVGKTGNQIDRGLRAGDFGRNLASSIALTQSAAITSATQVYSDTYEEAMGMGYGDEYAKGLAAQAASSTVNISRANILLNMTSANRFLGGTKNVKGFKPEKFLPSFKDKKMGSALKEGLQEATEENIELIAQETAQKEARRAMETGDKSKGAMSSLLDGNVYGDATYKEIMESTVLGAIGGIAQTGFTDLTNRIGSAKSFGGITQRFGTEVAETYDTTEFYPDGTIKHRAGDPIYELEDVMVENEEGKLVPDVIKSSIGKKDDEGNEIFQEETRKKVKLDAQGNPIARMKKTKFSNKELEQMEYDKQEKILKGFRNNVEKNAKTIATAKYQSHLENVVSDINDVVDTGKKGLGKDKRDRIVEDLARIEMVNSGTTEFDSDESKAKLEQLKETLGAEFDSMNESELRQKQEELMQFSLARTAIESFENNTKDHLIAQLNDMKNLTPEQAAELGYDEDYMNSIDDALGKIDGYYDRWMEYNTKRPGEIARALFKNRLKYDILNEDIKVLDDNAKAEHDKTVADYATKNDVDMTDVDENGVSTKFKYDQAFEIEKEKNRKLAQDRKLKELEKEQKRLQKELDVITNDKTKLDKGKAQEYGKKLESAINKVNKSLRNINARKKEVSENFDKRIKDLGVGKFKTSSQAQIYNKKLAAIEKAAELDRIFDELASPEGEARLLAIQRAKELKIAKRRSFLASMGELMELQEKDGGIYWGDGETPGIIKYDETTGEYTFETLPEGDFTMLASQKEFYESQLKPGAKELFEAHKRNVKKDADGKLTELNDGILKLERDIFKNEGDSKSYDNEIYVLTAQQESDPNWKTNYINKYTSDGDAKDKAVKELNRINRKLGRPVNKASLTPSKIVSIQAEQLKELRKLWADNLKKKNDLEAQKEVKVAEVNELNKSVEFTPVPDNLRMYKVTENEDGSINVSQNLETKSTTTKGGEDATLPASGNYVIIDKKGKKRKITHSFQLYSNVDVYDNSTGTPVLVGKSSGIKPNKGPKSFSFKVVNTTEDIESNTPVQVSVPLDYDNTIKNLRTRQPELAKIHNARNTYMKAYVNKIVRLDTLGRDKYELLSGNKELKQKVFDNNREAIDAFNDLVSLRDFIAAQEKAIMEWPNKTQHTIDHADPLANQLNSILAQFVTDRNELVTEEANNLNLSLKKIGRELRQSVIDVNEVDEEIKDIQRKIQEHANQLGTGPVKSEGAHKGWIKRLQKNLIKAKRTKVKLQKTIENRQDELAKYQSYIELLNNTKRDVNFVNTELNKLSIPIQQLRDDVEKWTRAIKGQEQQLDRVTERISYAKRLQEQLFSILSGRDLYARKRARMEDLQDQTMDRFYQIGEKLLGNDPDVLKEFHERIADLIYSEGEINIDELLTIAKNMRQKEGSTLFDFIRQLDEYNKLFNESKDIFDKIKVSASLSDQDIEDAWTDLENQITKDQREAELLQAFMGDSETQLAQAEKDINQLVSINAGSIEVLSKLNRKLKGNQVQHYSSLQELSGKANAKLQSQYDNLADMFSKITDLNKEINQLESEKIALMHYSNFLTQNRQAFMQESNIDVMNDMISYVAGSVDESGNNSLVKELESQIQLLEAHVNDHSLSVAELDNLIRLQKEFIGALNAGDTNMSPETLKERQEAINKLLEGNEVSKGLDGARQGLILNSGVLDLEAHNKALADIESRREDELLRTTSLQNGINVVDEQLVDEINAKYDAEVDALSAIDVQATTKEAMEHLSSWLKVRQAKEEKLRNLEDYRKRVDQELRLAKGIFEDRNTDMTEILDTIEELSLTEDEVAEKNVNKELSEGNGLREEDSLNLINDNEDWQRSKDTPYSTVSRHIVWDKGNKKRKYDSDGLPRLSQNPHDLRHLNFMNKYADNPEVFTSGEFKIEFISLSKPDGTARNENDYMNDLDLVQVDSDTGELRTQNGVYTGDKKALQADIDQVKSTGKSGIYAVVVNSKGERVYMNDAGDLKFGKAGEKAKGYEPIFSTIPNISMKEQDGKVGFSLNMGENMIVNKLGGHLQGFTKLSEFGDTVQFGGQLYYTDPSKQSDGAAQSRKDLVVMVKKQIMEDVNNFRQTILDSLNESDNNKVFAAINAVSSGDLLRRENNQLQSAGFLFNPDTFSRIVRTTEGKKSDSKLTINGVDHTVVPGVPYVLTKSGELIDVHSKKLDDGDINVILKLIGELVPEKGIFKKTGSFKVVGEDQEVEVNLVSVGKTLSDIGLLNKLLNWDGPYKGHEARKFMVWMKGGNIHFIPKDRDLKKHVKTPGLFFPVSELINYVNGKEVTEYWAKQNLPKFLKFLKDKRKHVHFKLTDSAKASATEYYHPELNNEGDIVLKKYENYNEYLSTIIETTALNPEQLDKVGAKSNSIGKYMIINNESLSDGKNEPIKVSTLQIDGATVKAGDKLVKGGVKGEVTSNDGNLTWNSIVINDGNISQFKFDIVKPKQNTKKTKTETTKADETTDNSVPLIWSKTPVLQAYDKIYFNNAYRTTSKDALGKDVYGFGNLGTEFTTVAHKTDGVVVSQVFKLGDTLYNDFYHIKSDGTSTLMSKEEWDPYRDSFNMSKSAVVIPGSELHNDTRGEALAKLGLGDTIKSIQDYVAVNIDGKFENLESDQFDATTKAAITKVINSLKMNNEFLNKYLPYITSGNPKFAEGIRIELVNGVTRLTSNDVGEDDGISLEYKIDTESEGRKAKTLSELVFDKTIVPNKGYQKLLASLMKQEDTGIGVKFIPHIHQNASISFDKGTNKALAIELSIGSLMRSNTETQRIAPIIAHELIHNLDYNEKVSTPHKERLQDVRNKLVSWLYKNNHKILDHISSDPNGNDVNSLAYWMFNKHDIEHSVFQKAWVESRGDVEKLMTALNFTAKEKVDSMKEFFANVMNVKDFQEFLNDVPMKDLGMKTKRGVKNVFQEFINILKDILSELGINIRSGHALEEVLEVGAAHYKANGLFKDVSGEVVYTSVSQSVGDNDQGVDLSENEDTEDVEDEQKVELIKPVITQPTVNEEVKVVEESTDDTETTETTEEGETIVKPEASPVSNQTEQESLFDESVLKFRQVPGVDEGDISDFAETIMDWPIDSLNRIKELSMDKLKEEWDDGKFDDEDNQYSLYSLGSNNINDVNISNNEIQKLLESKDYVTLLSKVLKGSWYREFMSKLQNEPMFQEHLEKVHGVTFDDATTDKLNEVINEYIDVINTDSDIDPALVWYKDSLNVISDALDKNDFKISKQSEMSKKNKELSSNYDFDGVDLTQVELTSIMEGMTHFLFDVFRKNDDADAFFASNLKLDVTYSDVRASMTKYMDEMMRTFRYWEDPTKDPIKGLPKKRGFLFAQQLIKSWELKAKAGRNKDANDITNQINNIKKLREQFLENTPENEKRFKELVRKHSDGVRNLGFVFSEDAIDNAMFDNELEAVKDKAFYENSTERNQKDSVPGSIKLLIGSLVNQKVNNVVSKEGKVVYENITNYLGLPKPNEFNDIYNLLVKKLVNIPGDRSKIMSVLHDTMMNEQHLSTKGSTLKSLTDSNSILNRIIDENGNVNSNITLNELNMLTQFIQTFSKFSPKFLLSRIDADGVIHYFDANKHKTSEQIMSQWQEGFNHSLIETIINTEDGKTIHSYGLDSDIASNFKGDLNAIKKIYDNAKKSNNPESSRKDAYDKLRTLLNKVGIEIQNVRALNEKIIESSKNADEEDNVFKVLMANDSIADKLNSNANDPGYNLIKDRSIEGTLKYLSEMTAETSNQAVDNQFISIDNKTIYAATLNHFLSIAANRINYAMQDPNGDLRKDTPHLFNVFTKNSAVRGWLENKEVSVEVGMFNGIVAPKEEGIVTKDLDSPDKWAMMISATMQGYYTFFRAADRGTENSFVFREKSGAVRKLYHDGPLSARQNSLNAYYGYLLDEVNAMVQHKNGLGKNIKYYDKQGGEFRFFSDDKLTDSMKKEIEKRIKRGDSFSQINTYLDKNKQEIKDSIEVSFKKKATSVKERIRLDGLLSRVPNSRKTVITYDDAGKPKTEYKDKANAMYYKGISPDILEPYIDFTIDKFKKEDGKIDYNALNEAYENALDNLLLDFNLFQSGAYIEQSKLFVGDPAMYKNSDDFFKRMSMMNSTKKISVMDAALDTVLNNTNRVDLKDGDTKVDFILTKEELHDLVANDFKLSKALSKDRTNELEESTGKKVDELAIAPMLGFNADYILGGGSYDGTFKSMIIEDIVTQSELAVDQVTRTDFNKKTNEFEYYKGSEKDGWVELDSNKDKVTKDSKGVVTEFAEVSLLRKTFTESFNKDGLPLTKVIQKVNSYLKPYLKMDEADAQAYTTMAGYKEILLRAGDWKPKHDKAYAKLIQGIELTKEELYLFRVLKTQYTGPLGLDDSNSGTLKHGDTVDSSKEDDNLFVPTGYKHSVFPLIPQLIKGTNLEKLNRTMQQNGVSLAHMTSANKFGRKLNENGSTNTVYDKDGKFTLGSEPIVSQIASYEYFGVQLDQAAKMKNRITTSTQFRKLVLSNLIDAGVPVDYMDSGVNELRKTTKYSNYPQARIEEIVQDEWNKLTTSEKHSKSPMYKLYAQYQDGQRELFKRPFDALIKELKLEATTEDGKIVGYHIGDRVKLASVALEMARDRNASDNVKKSIASLEEESTHIEHILSKDKVENVLFAIINSRIIREKRKGEGSPQVAASMLEGIDVTREGKEGKHFASPTLRHYLKGHMRADGTQKTLPSHCMIALPADLNEWVSQEYGSLEGFNKYLEEELHPLLDSIEMDNSGETLTKEQQNLVDLITIIGFRIPNQGLNSSDYMRVKKFLPTAAGDSIVVPTEMVAKAGSDFDIDKLNLYLGGYSKPRFIGGVWSAPTYEQFLDDSNSTDQSRYTNFIFNQVGKNKIKEATEAVEIDEAINEESDPIAGEEFMNILNDIFKATTTEEVKDLSLQIKLDPLEIENTEEYKFKVAQKLAEQNELLKFEKFMTLNYFEQNTTESIQNKMVELQGEIISLPYNYRQLMAPIDDSITKDQAWDVRGLNTMEGLLELYSGDESNFDDTKPANEQPMFLAQVRENELAKIISNSKGKAIKSIINSKGKFIDGSELTVVGKGVNITIKHGDDDVDLQQVNLTDDASFEFMLAMAKPYYDKKTGWIEKDDKRRKNKPLASIADVEVNMDKFINFLSGKAGVGQTAVHITHHQLTMAANVQLNAKESYWIFDHSTTGGKAHFASKKDRDGEWVSETLSAFLNAYVDIAKDPYIFDMNATNRTANMVFMLIRGGASIPWVTRFISQPIIKTYIQNQRANEPMFNKVTGEEKSKNAIIADTLAEYIPGDIAIPTGKKITQKEAKLAEAKTLVGKMIYSNNQSADNSTESLFLEYMLSKDEDEKEDLKKTASTLYDDADKLNKTEWSDVKQYMENGMFTMERLGEYILFDTAKKEARKKLIEMDPNHSMLEAFDDNLDVIIPSTVQLFDQTFLSKNPEIFAKTQQHVLDMFLEYQRQSQDFQMMIRATSADTKGSQKNMNDNNLFLEEVEKVKFKNKYTNLDKIYEDSVVSQAHKVVEQGVLMFQQLYYFEKNPHVKRSKRILTNMVESAMSLNADRKSKLRTTYDDDLSTALVTADIYGVDENGKDIPNPYSPTVVFDELFVKNEKNKYINQYGEPAPLAEIIFELNSKKLNLKSLGKKHKTSKAKPSVLKFATLKDNKLVKELLGVRPTTSFGSYSDFINNTELSSLAQFSTLQSRSRKLDVMKENELRNEFIIIKEFDKKNKTDLYNDLIKLVINQSGIHHNSPITFSKLIPNEDVGVLLTKAFDRFDRLSEDDQVKLLNQFNNQFLHRNITFVPNIKSAKRGGEYWIPINDARAQFPFLVHNKYDRKTNTFSIVGVVGRDSTKKFGKESKPVKRYSTQGDWKNNIRAEIYPGTAKMVGHNRFFVGYDLSLKDGKSGEHKSLITMKQAEMKFDDNAGEVALAQRESAIIKDYTNFQSAKDAYNSGKGVWTMRPNKNVKLPSTQHYGNPFSTPKKYLAKGTIVVDTVKEAVDAYKDWLGGTKHKSVEPERRSWILSQIKEGNLKGKELIYYKPYNYYSHADALIDIVNKSNKSNKNSTPVNSIADTFYDKETASKNPDTGFIFTENLQAYLAARGRTKEVGPIPKLRGDVTLNVGKTKNGKKSKVNTQAIVRTDNDGKLNKNALPIITKKFQQKDDGKKTVWASVAKKEGFFEDTDADYNLFVKYNTEVLDGIQNKTNFSNYVFPEGFATSKAGLPPRFVTWLQKELQNRFGLTTVVNNKGTGLLSTGISEGVKSKVNSIISDDELFNDRNIELLRELSASKGDAFSIDRLKDYTLKKPINKGDYTITAIEFDPSGKFELTFNTKDGKEWMIIVSSSGEKFDLRFNTGTSENPSFIISDGIRKLDLKARENYVRKVLPAGLLTLIQEDLDTQPEQTDIYMNKKDMMYRESIDKQYRIKKTLGDVIRENQSTKQYSLQPATKSSNVMSTKANDIRRSAEEKAKNDPCNK